MTLFPESSRIVEDQEGAANRILFRLAYSYAVAIIFWALDDPKQPQPTSIIGGSGVLIELSGNPYVVTCEHVIREFRTLAATDPRYRFQIGGTVIDLNQRLRDEERTLDLAIIDVFGIEFSKLGPRDDYELQPFVPTRWPPTPVARTGGLVVVCGFPGGPTREIDVEARNVVSPGFNFIDHVADVGEDHFLVPFNRDGWVNEQDEVVPESVRTLSLGGLSGCPVFTTRTLDSGLLRLELLGIVISEIPMSQDGVVVRSVNRISADGEILHHTLP